MKFGSETIVMLIAYMAVIFAVGYWAYKKTDNLSDYILGGRKLGPGVTALSVGASDMSGWLLLGLPGAIYFSGLGKIWIGIGLVIGAYLNWLLVAKRLRIHTEQANNALTLPEYFGVRFKDNANIIRLTSAVIILVFFTVYVASGLVSGAKLFQQVFQMDYYIALFSGAAVIIAYTCFGGFLAVSWTDFIQGCLMLLALLIVPIVAFNALGGVDPTTEVVHNINPQFNALAEGLPLIGIVSAMAWGLGYFGQPHILSRFMAIESADHVPTARRVAMGWMILSLIGAIGIGYAGIAYFADAPLGKDQAETVFLRLVSALLNPWVAGLLIAAIMSAIMSTIDSQLLVCSSVMVEDIYKSTSKKKPTEQQLVWLSRLSLVIVGAIAIVIALDKDSSILKLVSHAWAGFGCAFGPVILLSLYWSKLTKSAAVAAMITGGATVLVWIMIQSGVFGPIEKESFLNIYAMVPGFILSTLVAVVVSLIEDTSEYDEIFQDLSLNNKTSSI